MQWMYPRCSVLSRFAIFLLFALCLPSYMNKTIKGAELVSAFPVVPRRADKAGTRNEKRRRGIFQPGILNTSSRLVSTQARRNASSRMIQTQTHARPRASFKKSLFSKILKLSLKSAVLILGLSTLPNVAWAITTQNIQTTRVGGQSVLAAISILLGLAAIPLTTFFGAPSLVKSILVAACRCSVQVFLMGSLVLQTMFSVENPLLVAAWILGVGLIAGNEAFSRIQFFYPEMQRHIRISVLLGGYSVLVLAQLFSCFGRVDPWYNAKVLIPVSGMLFGNTLSATALAASSITKSIATSANSIELLLSRGGTAREAISPHLLEALSTALMPTINGLAVTGIVHIPGMMSGQILAGASASQAGLYQTTISLLITTTACITTQLILYLAVGSLLDSKHHRLRQGVLSQKEQTFRSTPLHKSFFAKKKKLPEKATTNDARLNGNNHENQIEYVDVFPELLPTKKKTPASHNYIDRVSKRFQNVQLSVKELCVPRAKSRISFELKCGDRLAITGLSGSGKSQILRSIVGLEHNNNSSTHESVILNGVSLESMTFPSFRTKVSLVSQNTVSMEGSPKATYQRIVQFENQQGKDVGFHTPPENIAMEWGVDKNLFDQLWTTLSGGEQQRVSLAIALALDPDILLLDESMSAVDEETTLQMEETLLNIQIPVIIVTHSSHQLMRFCTSQMKVGV